MNEHLFYDYLLIGWFVLAAAIFVTLFFVTAPYGRFARDGWGPRLNVRLAWVLMESPSWLGLTVLLLLSTRPPGTAAYVLYAMWLGHYIYRSLVYPITLTRSAHRVPVLIVVFGAMFNCGNAYLNGRWLFAFGPGYDSSWLLDVRFLCGIVVFCAGVGINQWADISLRRQRKAAGGGYIVPTGGLYSYICSPNYLGEILEWGGWALASWSVAGLSFFVWTVANLAPRAHAHRAWYRRTFTEFPESRKRLIPWIW